MIPATNMLLTLCIVNGTTNSKQVKKKKKKGGVVVEDVTSHLKQNAFPL